MLQCCGSLLRLLPSSQHLSFRSPLWQHLWQQPSDDTFQGGIYKHSFWHNVLFWVTCVMLFFSVNDALLLVLLDVCNQRHHLRCLIKRIQKSLPHLLWRCSRWICNSLDKQLFSDNIWYINSSDWTVTFIFLESFYFHVQRSLIE